MSVRDITILGCSSQQPTRYRNHGAYLVRWNEEGLLFDPGEGTQRQFIFANVAPTVVNRIFISHFHGDHCLGLGSMLMRLNLDKVSHPIHCYYPESGKKYFDRLRYGTIYHETIKVCEHPIGHDGIVHKDESFQITAAFLDHRVDNLGWKVQENERRKFHKDKLMKLGVRGPDVKKLQDKGSIEIKGKRIDLEEVSWLQEGDTLAVVLDTRYCDNALSLAQGAKVLICESTYLEKDKKLAERNYHLTAKQAAFIAKEAGAEQLILTHFSARYQEQELLEKEARELFPNSFAAEDLRVFPFPRLLKS